MSERLEITLPGPAGGQVMWIDAETVVAWSEQGERAIAIRSDGTLLGPAPVPVCDTQATAGGPVNAEGVGATAELVDGEVVLSFYEARRPNWPTGCWPWGIPDAW